MFGRKPSGESADGSFGVAIHRGGARGLATAAPAIATRGPEAVHGVRVHFGVAEAPAQIADATS